MVGRQLGDGDGPRSVRQEEALYPSGGTGWSFTTMSAHRHTGHGGQAHRHTPEPNTGPVEPVPVMFGSPPPKTAWMIDLA